MSGENTETGKMAQRDIEREKALYEAASLDEAVRHFLARWTIPDRENDRIARDFEADFIQIVQRIYREAQAPYIKAMADTIARAPMQPFILSGKLGKP